MTNEQIKECARKIVEHYAEGISTVVGRVNLRFSEEWIAKQISEATAQLQKENAELRESVEVLSREYTKAEAGIKQLQSLIATPASECKCLHPRSIKQGECYNCGKPIATTPQMCECAVTTAMAMVRHQFPDRPCSVCEKPIAQVKGVL